VDVLPHSLKFPREASAVNRVKSLLDIIDIVGFTILVELYIWRWQVSHRHAWIAAPIWLAVSFLVHRDTLRTLGWHIDNLKVATRSAAVVLGLFAAALIAIGLARGAATRIPQNHGSLSHLATYFGFCIFQQIVLNSLVANRLLELCSRLWMAAVIAGVIFAVAHWPNPVLVPLTFVGGAAMAWLFARERNILPLAVGQMILSLLIWWAFPLSLHHGLRVGPGYYSFTR
jgi:Type II CAAX prenyl endopeptidase Rce1-like